MKTILLEIILLFVLAPFQALSQQTTCQDPLLDHKLQSFARVKLTRKPITSRF
jgi:hypothetical protein